jgi:hypothetical protein
MNMNNDNPSAKAAGLKTLAAKALLIKLRQHSAFEIGRAARCDRLLAVQSALQDVEPLPAEIVAELAWRYCEAALALASLPSVTGEDFDQKLACLGVLDSEFLRAVDGSLVAVAVMATLSADAQCVAVPLSMRARRPGPRPGPGSVN